MSASAARNWSGKLDAAVTKASAGTTSDVLEFARTHATNELRRDVTMAAAQYNRARDDEEKEAALAELLELVERIATDRRDAGKDEIARQRERSKLFEKYRGKAPKAQTVFECKNLGFEYPGGSFVLSGVDLTLKEGEITGIFGGNANGKTTLFRLVVGQVRQTEGTLSYPILDPRQGPRIDWPAVKSEIAYVPQELPPLYGTMEENLRFAAASHGKLGAENDFALDYIVTRLQLSDFLDCKWRELSGGFKLRFSLARALITEPKLLALDEPLANLDYLSQLSVLRDIRNLASSYRDPIAVLITSQHLHEIEAVADKILFLERGKVVFYGEPGDVGRDADMRVFELDLPIDHAALREVLPASAGFDLGHSGLSYVVRTGLDTSREDLLRRLLKHKLAPEYFRDITKSVKQLFDGGPADTGAR